MIVWSALSPDTAGKLKMQNSWILAPEERNVYRARQAILSSSVGAAYAMISINIPLLRSSRIREFASNISPRRF
jgi:hypothetical protein